MAKSRLLKVLTYFVVVPLAVVLGIVTIVKTDSVSKHVADNNVLLSTYNAKALQNKPSSLRLDSNGSENSSVVTNAKQLKSLFTEMTTWKSGSEYTKHRNDFKSKVTGDDFYKKLYVEDKDATGNSMIDSLGVKSKTDNVLVYQISSNQYRIIFGAYGYKQVSDLQNVDDLDKKSYSVVVTGSTNHWNVTRIDEGFSER